MSQPTSFEASRTFCPALADRQRELIFTHQHDDSAEHRAEDDILDFRRLHRVRHEHLQ